MNEKELTNVMLRSLGISGRGPCGKRREVVKFETGLAGGRLIDLVGLHLKSRRIQQYCTVSAWLGSQPILA